MVPSFEFSVPAPIVSSDAAGPSTFGSSSFGSSTFGSSLLLR
jgi:hypothetical protein